MQECEICSGQHDADAHGDPLVIRDWGARNIVSMVSVAILDAMSITQDARQDECFQKLATLYDEWNALPDTEVEMLDADIEPGEFLDDVERILSDAGYLAYSDADAGSWLVYRTIEDVSAIG